MSTSDSLFVAYVPGLDRRRLEARDTPFLASLLRERPAVRLRTHPTTELFPTLISGVNPPDHLVWQVSRQDEKTPPPAVVDRLPDWISSTAQCVRHAFDSGFDLPAIPARRRRRFQIHRLKYTRRAANTDLLNELAGFPTLFGILGERARYRISTRFSAIPSLLRSIPGDRFAFDFLEFYAFDLISHWNLDRPSFMARHARLVDRFVESIVKRCAGTGTRVVLLVDHGQERVAETINVQALARRSGADPSDVLEYIEVGVARFWFDTDAARSAVRTALERDARIIVKMRSELAAWGLDFPDDRFGELYAIARPGSIFFPHDFYHPLANLYMGLSKPRLWRRLFNPVHRGSHGQLPSHPAEEGFLLLLDERFEPAREEAELIDFAPTMLKLLGREAPATMKGTPIFRPRERAAS